MKFCQRGDGSIGELPEPPRFLKYLLLRNDNNNRMSHSTPFFVLLREHVDVSKQFPSRFENLFDKTVMTNDKDYCERIVNNEIRLI